METLSVEQPFWHDCGGGARVVMGFRRSAVRDPGTRYDQQMARLHPCGVEFVPAQVSAVGCRGADTPSLCRIRDVRRRP